MEKLVIIRGYGDYSHPTICTYYEKAKESEAINIIEDYLNIQTEYKKQCYDFEIRTEDDTKHLYCYLDGKIY